MTVISALRLNPEMVVIIGDELTSSTSGRKYPTALKIHTFDQDVKAAIGGAGATDFLGAVAKVVVEKAPQATDGLAFAQTVAASLVEVRDRSVDGYLRANHGISLAEARQASLETKTSGMTAYKNVLTRENGLVNALNDSGELIVTVDKANADIYTATPNSYTPMWVSRAFECIGSGADAADATLAEFVSGLTREQRQQIPVSEGLAAVIRATHQAERFNGGVEGTPSIAIVEKGKVTAVAEDNSHLALEMVSAANMGLLPRAYVLATLPELVLRNGDFESAEKEMWSVAPDATTLNRFLRSYKIRNKA